MPRLLPPAARRSLPVLAVLALAGPFAAGCGGSAGDGDADPAAAVPPRAPLYVEATVRPEGEMKADAEAAAKKVLGTDDPGKEIIAQLEKAGKKEKLDFEKDVEPWLGKRVGLFVSSFSGDSADAAVVAASKDDEKAEDFIADQDGRERTYRDAKYKVDGDTAYGVIDGYVVTGTEAAVKQVVDATAGESLADAQRYKDAVDKGGDDDALGRAYVDPQGILDAVARGGGTSAQGLAPLRQLLAGSGTKAVLANFSADADALRLTAAGVGSKGTGGGKPKAGALGALPGDAWLGLAIGDVGPTLEKQLDQFAQLGGLGGVDADTLLQQLKNASGLDVREDLLKWMGQGAIFASGTSGGDVGGALVVESKDPAASRRAVPRLGRLVRALADDGVRVSELTQGGVDAGVTLRAEGFPLPIHIAAEGDKFVLAIGTPALKQALNPTGALSDNADFKAVSGQLSKGVEPALWLGVGPVLELAQSLGAGESADFDKVRDALDAFRGVVAGGGSDGDVQKLELVAGLK